eukprot:5833853-Pyramimonas_sp.AAC.1
MDSATARQIRGSPIHACAPQIWMDLPGARLADLFGCSSSPVRLEFESRARLGFDAARRGLDSGSPRACP